VEFAHSHAEEFAALLVDLAMGFELAGGHLRVAADGRGAGEAGFLDRPCGEDSFADRGG